MCMRSRQHDPRFLAKSQLIKDRAWTETMIAEFLGEPDKQCINPHCSTGPLMCLYWVNRVIAAESTPAVARRRAEILARRQAVAEARQTRQPVMV